MADFGSLYNFNTNGGSVSVIPDTNAVKAKITSAMGEIFGGDVSTDEATPIGRLIEALTMLYVDTLGVNAQNANNFNPNFASGNSLDAIGALFDTTRLEDQTDASFRKLLLESQSRGSGFAQSIRNELSNVDGVKNICVLDNGYEDPTSLPNSDYGIAVAPHSIFVAVAGGSNADVAAAIYKTKSAGCGYTTSGNFGEAEKVEVPIADGSGNKVIFFRPSLLQVNVEIDIVGDLSEDDKKLVQKSVKNLFGNKGSACRIYDAEVIAEIARTASGIACTGVRFYYPKSSLAYSDITIMPYQYCDIGDNDITIRSRN